MKNNFVNSLAQLHTLKYKRSLPTAFDESLTLVEKMNKIIDHLIGLGEVTEEVVKQWNEVMEWIENEGLTERVYQRLDEMAEDGTLDQIINTNIFNQLNEEINRKLEKTAFDDFKEDIEQQIEKVIDDVELKTPIISVLEYGLDPSGELDNTELFNQMMNEIPENSKVEFPTGVYKGHFEIRKNIQIDFQNSLLINVDDDKPIISVEGEETQARVVTGKPSYSQQTFVLSDISNLKRGDIGYLYDESVRPNDSTPKINVEMLKVSGVIGNLIYVEDMIRSDMNTGVVFFVKVNPLKNIKISNVKIRPTDTHNSHALYVAYCDRPILDNVQVSNYTRHGVRFHYCYSPIINYPKITDPVATGSGQGYAVSFEGCREGYVGHIFETGARHTVDMSGSYNCLVFKGEGTAGIYLAHNGFGGSNKIKGFKTKTNGSVATVSRQGVADLDKVVARGYSIEDVEIVVPTNTPDMYSAPIYFQTDYADILIKNIHLTYVDASVDPIGTNPSNLIRFNGNPKGEVIVDGVSGNVVGNVIRCDKRSDEQNRNNTFKVDNVYFEKVSRLLSMRGIENIEIGSVKAKEVLDVNFNIVSYFTQPFKVHHTSSDLGNTVKYNITGIATSGLLGSPPKLNNNALNVLNLTSGGKIEEHRLLNSADLIIVNASSPITMSSETPFDPPKWAGQTVKVLVSSGSSDITIPTGTNVITTSPIVMSKNGVYEFVAYNGSWYLKQ